MSGRREIFRLQALRLIFRSLRHRNYRYYFFGQSISLMGAWIQNVAMGWLVYRLTGSAMYLGIIAFAGQIPSLVVTPLAGVFTDWLNQRRTLIITQSMAMLTTLTLAVLVLLDIATVVHLIAISIIAGVINAFDNPFRHAFVLEIIGNRDDLPNAIALNSSLNNSARFIGPLIGGVLISLVGEGWCFLINGISYSAVVLSLLYIKVTKSVQTSSQGSILRQLTEGLQYSWSFKPIRYPLMLIAICGLIGLPFQALLPAFAANVLEGSATLLGTLIGSLGAGALTGALFLASRQKMQTLPANIITAALLFSIALGFFSQSHIVVLSMLTLFITGFGMIVMFNATNALLQGVADSDKRGRVISLYSLTFMGMPPLGNLMTGALAEYIGVGITVLIMSVICLTAILALRKQILAVKPLLEI
ncbi:MAG TPA: MFS transporter [Bacteroidales bacterium]|nr:MFS transporter [Bacteroidales bacterium]